MTTSKAKKIAPKRRVKTKAEKAVDIIRLEFGCVEGDTEIQAANDAVNQFIEARGDAARAKSKLKETILKYERQLANSHARGQTARFSYEKELTRADHMERIVADLWGTLTQENSLLFDVRGRDMLGRLSKVVGGLTGFQVSFVVCPSCSAVSCIPAEEGIPGTRLCSDCLKQQDWPYPEINRSVPNGESCE